MNYYLSFLFLCATLWPGIDCATIGPLTFLDTVLPNTTLGAPIDPHFSLQPHYTTTRLSATAILMNTIVLLAEAADVDIKAPIDFNRHATFDQYPSVVIDLQPVKRRMRLENSFLVWALYEAAFDMIKHTKFFVSEFDLVWHGKVIAWLRYQKAEGVDTSIEAGAQEVSDSTSTQLPSNSTPTTMTSQNATSTSLVQVPLTDTLSLHLRYLLNAKDLPIFTVFMIVIATLKDSAAYLSNTRVVPFETSVRGLDVTLAIMLNDGPPIRRPPFFDYHHVTHAVKQLPGFMLKQRRFAEVAWKIDMNGNE